MAPERAACAEWAGPARLQASLPPLLLCSPPPGGPPPTTTCVPFRVTAAQFTLTKPEAGEFLEVYKGVIAPGAWDAIKGARVGASCSSGGPAESGAWQGRRGVLGVAGAGRGQAGVACRAM